MHRASLSSTLCVHFSSTIVDAASDDVVGYPETAAASGWFGGRAREVGERVLTAFGRSNAGTIRGDRAVADRYLNLFFRI